MQFRLAGVGWLRLLLIAAIGPASARCAIAGRKRSRPQPPGTSSRQRRRDAADHHCFRAQRQRSRSPKAPSCRWRSWRGGVVQPTPAETRGPPGAPNAAQGLGAVAEPGEPDDGDRRRAQRAAVHARRAKSSKPRPGLIVTQHSGEGKANQYFLRGYNLDHGTDLAITVDDMPVNMRTHAHGQGYADLNWLMPETDQFARYSARGRISPTRATSPRPAICTSASIDSVKKNIAQATLGSFGYRALSSAWASTKLGQRHAAGGRRGRRL